jgi:hypothetical protein
MTFERTLESISTCRGSKRLIEPVFQDRPRRKRSRELPSSAEGSHYGTRSAPDTGIVISRGAGCWLRSKWSAVE